jgi:hypothetical protein
MTTEAKATLNSRKPTHTAFQVRDTTNGKGFWNRIGVAWSNRDGSLSLQLECVPLDGRVVLQLADKKKD